MPDADLEADNRDLTEKEMLDALDAYGHLTWTVGNEDWLACADFAVFVNRDGDVLVAYHVVVDCESGCFTDTPEAAVVNLKDDESLLKDGACPLWSYADACTEQYATDPDFPVPEAEDVEKACASWGEALRATVERARAAARPGEPRQIL